MNTSELLPRELTTPDRECPKGSLRLRDAVLLLVRLVVLEVACLVALFVLHALTNATKPTDSQAAMYGAAASVLAMAAVIRRGVRRSHLPWPAVLPLHPFRPLVLAALLPAALGLGILGSEVENLTRALGLEPEFFREITRQMTRGGFWSVIAILAVAPIAEELLFRGVILTGFLRRYGAVRAVVYSAILFAVIHLNPCQIGAAFIGGLFLGWLYVRAGSLWPCIAMHAIYNSQCLSLSALCQLLHVQIRGFSGVSSPGLVEFQPAWFDAIGVALLLLGIWGVMRVTGCSLAEVAGKQQHGLAACRVRWHSA
jgi:membrane protease YdiL (CAAX protease family)